MTGPNYRCRILPAFDSGARLYVCTDELKPGELATVRVATGFTWAEHQEGDAWVLADGIGHADGLIQAILDEAWQHGFRPRGFADVKNETAAIREHLGDMKTVAFHLLKIKQGK